MATATCADCNAVRRPNAKHCQQCGISFEGKWQWRGHDSQQRMQTGHAHAMKNGYVAFSEMDLSGTSRKSSLMALSLGSPFEFAVDGAVYAGLVTEAPIFSDGQIRFKTDAGYSDNLGHGFFNVHSQADANRIPAAPATPKLPLPSVQTDVGKRIADASSVGEQVAVSRPDASPERLPSAQVDVGKRISQASDASAVSEQVKNAFSSPSIMELSAVQDGNTWLPRGTLVEYFSESNGRAWISGIVQGNDGTCYQLDVHERALPEKVRLRDFQAHKKRQSFLLWSPEMSSALCKESEWAKHEGKAKLLPKQWYTSVRMAVQHLNEDKKDDEFVVCFSLSVLQYFVLYRRGCQKKALDMFGLIPAWSKERSVPLCDVNDAMEELIGVKATILDSEHCKTVEEAVSILNYPFDCGGSIIYSDFDADYCVVQENLRYVLLFKNDAAKDVGLSKIGLSISPTGRFIDRMRGRLGNWFGSTPSPEVQSYDPKKLISTYAGDLQEKYEILRILGSGAQGTAHLVKHRGTSVHYVAKDTNDMSEKGFKEFMDEFEKMKQLKHPNCLKVFEVVDNKRRQEGARQVFLITEYALGADLCSYMRVMMANSEQLNEQVIATLFDGAMKGVAYLHECGITHNDLKPENLLVMDKFAKGVAPRVVVADYGCATFDVETGRIFFGDPRYMSPEGFRGIQQLSQGQKVTKPDQKVDVWAMGVTIYGFLSHHDVIPFIYSPCQLHDVKTVFTQLQAAVLGPDQIEFRDWTFSDHSKELLKAMFDKDAKKRPTAEECLRMKWFKMDEENGYKKNVLSAGALDHIVFKDVRNRVRLILRNAVATRLRYEHVERCHKVFSEFDPDCSGKVDRQEFKGAWTRMGKWGADEIFIKADVDKNGYLDFTEFVALSLNWENIDAAAMNQYLDVVFSDLSLLQHGEEGVELDTFRKAFEDTFGVCEDLDKALVMIDLNKDRRISMQELSQFVQGSELNADNFVPTTSKACQKRYSVPITSSLPLVRGEYSPIGTDGTASLPPITTTTPRQKRMTFAAAKSETLLLPVVFEAEHLPRVGEQSQQPTGISRVTTR